MIIQHRLLPLCLIVLLFPLGRSLAEEPFPAPMPNAAPSASSTSPSVAPLPSISFPDAGALSFSGPGFQQPMSAAPQSGWRENCMAEFMPLREEAERRGKLIKAASDRHAAPDEACKLISSFGQAEIKMIKYIEAHTTSCGIPAQIADQLKNGHKGTEALQDKVCTIAEQKWPQHAPAGPAGDFVRPDELTNPPKGPS